MENNKSILKKQKNSCRLPLLVNGVIISNFSPKASLFNKLFASQCTPLQNSSGLPTFYLKTDKTLSSLNLSENDIFAIIKNLNSSKSHGWDTISIRTIKDGQKQSPRCLL